MKYVALLLILSGAPPILAARAAKIGGAPSVSLDVKDADAREILASMQKQCGIKNLIIDKEVQTKGTFYFKNVPCKTAFSVVFRTLGLDAQVYPNSVITASPRH